MSAASAEGDASAKRAASPTASRGLGSPGRRRGVPPPQLTTACAPTPPDASISPGDSGAAWTPSAAEGGRVCVVLDFDLTLARVHVYKELCRLGFGSQPSELGKEKIFGNEERISMLTAFLTRLRGRQCHITVLTNNTEQAVCECLEIGGLSHFVDEVVTVDPCSTKGRDMKRLRPPGVTRWVFADDDVQNIRSVERETMQRVPCILVDGGQGLQPRHIAAIEQAAFPTHDFGTLASKWGSLGQLPAISPTFGQRTSTCGQSRGGQTPEAVPRSGPASRISMGSRSPRRTSTSASHCMDCHDEFGESLGQTLHRAVSLVAKTPAEEEGLPIPTPAQPRASVGFVGRQVPAPMLDLQCELAGPASSFGASGPSDAPVTGDL
eukprot:TRINITY_DN10466_c0_g1_i1.p1 TRINITY_DN10466_c0_g1~~TRINITY_DN10466_c0_g1_i1.p1  ORF type:complete len:414 (+),score=63.24 TRINITY_DN10466_c0_g1_i1:105-1244(+)